MPTWFHDCYSHNIRGVGQEGICITDHGQNWTRDCWPIGDLFICQPLENSLGIHMSATWKWFGDDGSTCICSIQTSGTEIQWGVTCLSSDLQQKGCGCRWTIAMERELHRSSKQQGPMMGGGFGMTRMWRRRQGKRGLGEEEGTALACAGSAAMGRVAKSRRRPSGGCGMRGWGERR